MNLNHQSQNKPPLLPSPTHKHRPSLPSLPTAGEISPPAEATETAMFDSSRPQHPLFKQRSLPNPDLRRRGEETWKRRAELHRARRRSGIHSVTDDDFDELRGCIELGFSFGDTMLDNPEEAKRLSQLLPALDVFYDVRRSFSDVAAGSSSSADGSPKASPIISPGDTEETVKVRLKQWAKVVACSILQKRGS